VRGLRPNTVAVGAHHITLSNLDGYVRPSLQHRSALGQPKRLQRGVAMIEVHLVRRKHSATVNAWDIADLT
jgi:hypothetical protein